MALISCPECGKEISDKVKACPHCGYPLQSSSTEEKPQQVEVTKISINAPKAETKKKLILGGLAVVVVALVLVAVIAVKNSGAEAAYVQNLSDARITMLSGGAKAESLCNITKAVWYNTIHEKESSETNKYTKNGNKFNDDFNTSLSLLYADSDIIAKVSEIKENQETVADLMDKLRNPPKEYDEAYEVAKELYDYYCDFTALAISPTGSLNTYSQNFGSIDSNFMKSYDKLGRLIPEES